MKLTVTRSINMSTVSRLQFNAMMDIWGAFDTSVKLSEQALASNKTKKYKGLKQLVHENYFKFDKDFRNYKADIIEKQARTEANFNGSSIDEQTGESSVNYQHNDQWAAEQMVISRQPIDEIIQVKNIFHWELILTSN